MKKFHITVTATVIRVYEVDATDADSARKAFGALDDPPLVFEDETTSEVTAVVEEGKQ